MINLHEMMNRFSNEREITWIGLRPERDAPMDTPFAVGNATLTGTGRCQPCSKMERALGFGGYNAVRGHGGIATSVVEDGIARVGDRVIPAIA